MNYSEKLRDPRWQKKRLEILERDKFTCRHCESTDTPLNIHHIAYHKEPWDVPNDLLITLCEYCHEAEQIELKQAQTSLIKFMKESGCMSGHFIMLAEEYFHKSKLK